MPSLLEAQYGHIIPKLTQAWGAAELFERFIGTLFFDARWDRKGWPAEACQELQFLHDLHRMAYAEQYPESVAFTRKTGWVVPKPDTDPVGLKSDLRGVRLHRHGFRSIRNAMTPRTSSSGCDRA